MGGLHFYVMYPAPADPCFYLTKRGFINAILCKIVSRKGSAAVVLGSILVAASLVTCLLYCNVSLLNKTEKM